MLLREPNITIKSLLRSLAAVAAMMCVASPLTAASTGDADSLIMRIDARMAVLDSLIFTEPTAVEAPQFMAWSTQYQPDTAYNASLDAVKDARIDAYKAQTGIQVTGQTYYRPDAKIGLDDEEDGAAVSRYVGKIQIEARWYFLQSGLINRDGFIAEQELSTAIDRLERENKLLTPDLYATRERIRLVSDSVLASVLLHRVENLALLEDAYMFLLESESISSDNLLRILDDRAEAERRLVTMAHIPTKAPHLEGVPAGTVSVDSVGILNLLADNDINLQILKLRADLIDQKAANTTWWSDVRVAPFVRYSHYFRHDMPSSANVDLGISFTIPINTVARHERRVMMAEKDMLVYRHDDLMQTAADKVRYLALEIDRLNRSVVGEWERASSLRRYLLLRRQAYARRAGEYNRLSAMMEYNSYLRCLENIIELQYRRDCLLAELQALVPKVALSDYCTFTPLTPTL